MFLTRALIKNVWALTDWMFERVLEVVEKECGADVCKKIEQSAICNWEINADASTTTTHQDHFLLCVKETSESTATAYEAENTSKHRTHDRKYLSKCE